MEGTFCKGTNGQRETASNRAKTGNFFEQDKGETHFAVPPAFRANGIPVLETTTWRPDGNLTAKQAERAAQNYADEFERQIRATVSGSTATSDTPNITFKEYAAQWL